MSYAEDMGYDGYDEPMSVSEAYTAGDGEYVNQKGENVIIEDMSTEYLINAYNYFLKHAGKNNDLVIDLKSEIRHRKI